MRKHEKDVPLSRLEWGKRSPTRSPGGTPRTGPGAGVDSGEARRNDGKGRGVVKPRRGGGSRKRIISNVDFGRERWYIAKHEADT